MELTTTTLRQPTFADEERAYELASIAASELVSPNSPEWDEVHERQYDIALERILSQPRDIKAEAPNKYATTLAEVMTRLDERGHECCFAKLLNHIEDTVIQVLADLLWNTNDSGYNELRDNLVTDVVTIIGKGA